MRLEAEESARLEEEREAEEQQRQADLAAAEEQRLAELEAARKQEELESRQAAETAMKELQARLDRGGSLRGCADFVDVGQLQRLRPSRGVSIRRKNSRRQQDLGVRW